jgi:hypothetical protein
MKRDVLFVAILTYYPELCFGGESYKEQGKKWVDIVRDSVRSLVSTSSVPTSARTSTHSISSSRLTTSRAKAELLGPPILTHHRARISSVIAGLSFMR